MLNSRESSQTLAEFDLHLTKLDSFCEWRPLGCFLTLSSPRVSLQSEKFLNQLSSSL